MDSVGLGLVLASALTRLVRVTVCLPGGGAMGGEGGFSPVAKVEK